MTGPEDHILPDGSNADGTPATLPDHLQYIIVEGVIGAGKTTLAAILANRFRAQLVLESPDENPFLEKFYEDRERWAFQTQLSYLASRFRQQQSLLKLMTWL